MKVSSEVEGDSILLGDVADVDVEPSLMARVKAIDLGAPPFFGSRRGLSESYIMAKMRNQGIKMDKITVLCPPTATVTRKSQTVTPEALLKAAQEAAVDSENPYAVLRASQKLYELKVPLGALEIQAGQISRSENLISVNLAITVDGKSVAYREVSLVPAQLSTKAKPGDPIRLRITRGLAAIEVDAKVRVGGAIGAPIIVETETGAKFTAIYKAAGLAEVKQ